MAIEVSGHSDDCIEVEGDFQAEFYATEDGGDFLAFSDGTVLHVEYTNAGIWRINKVESGAAKYSKTEATNSEDDYTDKVTLIGEIRWVVCGKMETA